MFVGMIVYPIVIVTSYCVANGNNWALSTRVVRSLRIALSCCDNDYLLLHCFVARRDAGSHSAEEKAPH